MLFQLFFPLLVVISYIWFSTSTLSQPQNLSELTILIFTASVFYIAFYLKKLNNKIETIIYSIFYFIFILILFSLQDISNSKLSPFIWQLVLFSFTIYILWKISHQSMVRQLKKCLTNYFIKKFNHKEISNISICCGKYLFSTEYKEKKEKKFNLIIKEETDLWSKIIHNFSNHHKKESTNLAKKNKLIEKFHIEYKSPSIINILDIEHKIKILNTFNEAIINIAGESKEEEKPKEEQASYIKQINLLHKLIFQSKLIHHYMKIHISLKKVNIIINYFKYLLISIIVLTVFFKVIYLPIETDKFFLINNINIIKNLYIFSIGLFILITITPLSYIYFTCLKLNHLKVDSGKHNRPIILINNLSYYMHTFFFAIIFIIIGIGLLAHSGVAYNHFFDFIISLILPNFELNDIPKQLSIWFGKNIIFGIFMIKIIFLMFLFSLIALFIRHIIEIYVENYDDATTTSSKYAIPPEFAKFFSYLVLSIFAIILLYGTLFINYPNLSQEYQVCQHYIVENYNTEMNCRKAKKETNLTEVIEYCKNIEDNNSNIKDCLVGMSIEQNKNTFASNASISSPARSLSDYLPLSIFLALFGTVIMFATRNLLENYFTGLSLKINQPYEEGERVKIDNGEMLAVKNIGFRATTFYDISSNAELVIPHHKLTNSIIVNYTKPTLDYRRKITIYVPDRTKNSKNIPREVEKVLLLSAFIATGVKRPRLPFLQDEIRTVVEAFQEKIKPHLNKSSTEVEAYENESKYEIDNIWKKLISLENEEDLKKLFLHGIVKLTKEKSTTNDKEKKIIKKITASIISVLFDYKKSKNFNYHIDNYLVKRKFNSFKITKLNKDEIYENFDEIAEYLVNINYYYFALAKQLWSLKVKNKSQQKQKDFDTTSLELLDVPRVTSEHKRDFEGAFWEMSLLVTVELGEQSDEIIQHINMFIDELWDIFDLPSRCKIENE